MLFHLLVDGNFLLLPLNTISEELSLHAEVVAAFHAKPSVDPSSSSTLSSDPHLQPEDNVRIVLNYFNTFLIDFD